MDWQECGIQLKKQRYCNMHKHLKTGAIKTLFLDIGGVLLTNGWGHESRKLAAEKYGLDLVDFEERHELVFDAYELGKMTLDEYLNMVVFFQKRAFSAKEFKAFMFEQSKALDGHIDFFKELKRMHLLKVIAVSNEGREINEYRINQFGLDTLFDAYVSSCYVHLHKPDIDMLKMACDISHTPPEQALYVDDNCMMADLASIFGLHSLQFQGIDNAKEFLNTCKFHNQ